MSEQEEPGGIVGGEEADLASAIDDAAPGAAASSGAEDGGDASSDEAAPEAGRNPLMSYFDTDDEGGSSSSLPSSVSNSDDDEVASTPAPVADAAAESSEATPSVEDETDTSLAAGDADSAAELQSDVANDVTNEVDGEATTAKTTPAAGETNEKIGTDDGEAVKQSNDESKNDEGSKSEEDDKAEGADQSEKPSEKKRPESSSSGCEGGSEQRSATPPSSGVEGLDANLSPNSLVEAERQAAIAAAMSANSSSMSPSVAAGIAKVLALPGIMSDKVSEMSETASSMAASGMAAASGMTNSGGAGGSRTYPPPPPPRNNGGGYQASPTMVALPPAPPPYPMQGKKGTGMPMRPVRFDDVKVALGELMEKELKKEKDNAESDKDGSAKNEEDESKPSGELEDKPSGKQNDVMGEGETSAPVADEEKKSQEGGDDTTDASGDVGEKGSSPATKQSATDEGESSVTATSAEKEKSSSGTESKPGDAAKTTPDVVSKKAETPTEKKEPETGIPDSFLRFLLLVARVPIIIEEHKKPPSKAKKSDAKDSQESAAKEKQKVPPAATAAANRAYEILCMARKSYETISRRQEENNSPDASGRRRRDATASFFAACAGEQIDDDFGEPSETAGPTANGQGGKGLPPPSPPSSMLSSSTASTSASTAASSTPMAAASSMASSASAAFSGIMSKMSMPKKQASFSEIGKKLMSGSGHGNGSSPRQGERRSSQDSPKSPSSPRFERTEDYEVTIDNEMLGLTVENVLERTVIRTLLPDGAAKRAGAQVGSLIAKVGNVDTSNLTHFETIDELRRSQRPLKLTLRHVGGDVLRRAREEMGRLIRGHGLTAATSSGAEEEKNDRPWRGQEKRSAGETFDSVLGNRWPSRSTKSSLVGGSAGNTPPLAMTRAESMHRAGRSLIRILALMVVGLEEELSGLNDGVDPAGPHLTAKELGESIEISSKILLDFARGLPDVDEKGPRSPPSGGAANKTQQPSSSFYPVPPGRVQGKKGPAGGAGRGKGAQRGKKGPSNSPLLRIGDALQRTRSFLVELLSTTATSLRWEIIDYLCVVLDLDTEQELSEKESASSTSGKGGGEAGSPMNDLGAAGSILKLIVLNCSTAEDALTAANDDAGSDTDSQSSLEQSSLDQSSRSASSSNSGNCFLSVVHRLAASKSTSARVSACSLGPVLWGHLDFPRQLQLRGVITRALHDVEVAVRKSTAAVLHEVAELVFDRRAVPWLVLMCERSMTDPEPQLRAAAMTLTWHLAEHLPNAFLGDARQGSRSLRRLPPRDSPTFMDVYLLQCKLLPVANNLAEDRVASVRLSVAAQCDRLSNALGEHWFSVIIDLLQALLSDNDERVRSEAILCVPRMVESVIEGTSSDGRGSITVLESLLPLALKMQKDSSAVVRSSLATATGELLIFLVGLGGGSSAIEAPPSPGNPPMSPGRGSGVALYADHKKHVDDTLIPILQKLLQDSDPEVTTASLRAVTNASRSSTAREPSIPSRTHKFSDPSSNVDDDLVSLSSHGTHHSHQSHLSHERSKPVFIPVLSEKQVLRLLPTLSNLATSAQWRVRQSAVEIVPALMGCTHRKETRHEISKLCLRLMEDKVDAVRKTAAECLCLGGGSLARHGEEDGGEWIREVVVPHLKTCSGSEDSKQRLLSLKMVEIIISNGLCPTRPSQAADNPSPKPSHDDDESTASSATESERPVRTILSVAASHASDRVANVRLNVGRTFGSILPLLDRSDVDFAVETLERQLEEETGRPNGGDRDVIYFARQAIAVAQPLRRMSSTLSANQ